MVTSTKTIVGLGALATFGAFMGVVADMLSVWSPNTNQMGTAFSVSLENIVGLYEGKPRWSYVLGNYIGIYFIPFHILGFFLIFQALKPASVKWARVFLVLALYLTPIGVGLHGSLAFVGDIIQSKDANLIGGMRDYWQPWAYSLVFGYAIVSTLIALSKRVGKARILPEAYSVRLRKLVRDRQRRHPQRTSKGNRRDCSHGTGIRNRDRDRPPQTPSDRLSANRASIHRPHKIGRLPESFRSAARCSNLCS
jgi:hypothetical protein